MIFSFLHDMGCVVRDDRHRLVWCNQAYADKLAPGRDRGSLVGSTLADRLHAAAAAERARVHEQVIRTGHSHVHAQLCCDRCVVVTTVPIDPGSFGHTGVMAVLRCPPAWFRLAPDAEVYAVPVSMRELARLSRRELEVLYLLTYGASSASIAHCLFRSVKTVEHHVGSLHAKLGTGSRAELVRFAVERGLGAFTWEQWAGIIANVPADGSAPAHDE